MKAEERAGAPSACTRRLFLIAPVAAVVSVMLPGAAQAKPTYTMDENGGYVEVKETDFTEVWKDRASRMQTMSPDEIFMAGRGAGGKVEVSELSDAGKKRRALAGCRVDATRKQVKAAKVDERRAGGLGVEAASEALASLRAGDSMTEKACTTRVLQGDLSFILDVM